MSKSVAIITTAATFWTNKAGDNVPSGCWYEELAVPYLKFTDAGYNVRIFNCGGTEIPFDPASLTGDFFTAGGITDSSSLSCS